MPSPGQWLILAAAFLLVLVNAVYLFVIPADCRANVVCDKAKLMATEQHQRLAEYHAALLAHYDIDYRIFTQSHSVETATALFKAAAIGERSRSRKGLLLVINTGQNLVRLEVSAGLDAVYTDGFIAYIQQRQMIPFFKANRISDGILATTEMIVTRAQEAVAGKAFIAPENLPQNLAIGAGAETSAAIGEGQQAAAPSVDTLSPDGLSPEQVVAAYHKALADGNIAPDLAIYSQATQALRQQWVVTPAQMKNELKAYRSCTIDKAIQIASRQAVVRYPVGQRACAPYFLTLEGGAWRLDFTTMMQNIHFSVDNAWHFDMRQPIPYEEAFKDWRIDQNGYPHPPAKMRWGITVRTDPGTGITRIEKIFPGTPAQSMPIQESDIVLQWDNLDRPTNSQISRSMDSLEAGQNFLVRIGREGGNLVLELTAPPRVQ